MKPGKQKQASTTITVGNVTDVSGEINIAGGDIHKKITSHQDASIKIVNQTLTEALTQTRKRSKTTRAKKAAIEQEVNAVKAEAEKKKADKSFLTERFNNLAKMAPDILDVIITGLGNPPAGIALAMKKIAQKAKAEAEKESDKP